MKDRRLKYKLIDRAERAVFDVETKELCDCCGSYRWKPTGQELRFKVKKDGRLTKMVDLGELGHLT